MVDAKKARKAAEDAAREALAGTLVGAAGELGVAQAEHERVTVGSEIVEAKVAEVMAAAAAEADKLHAEHAAAVERADEAYALAWQAARDAGWSTTQLSGMGYRRPSTGRRGRRETTAPRAVEPDSHESTATADVA